MGSEPGEVIMPKPSLGKKPPAAVAQVDFGFTSATEFWDEIVIRAHTRFLGHESRQHAVEAAWAIWHLHEWLWHDKHPGGRTSGADYMAFRDGLLNSCPELAWMRDITDAGKHRELGRGGRETTAAARKRSEKGEVPYRPSSAEQGHTGAPLCIHVDGDDHDFADALERVIGWWRSHHFPG
jgi:hypothetical protein